jgi:hypothetical protein
MIEINSNGSKWYGQKPDDIPTLLEVLKTETLDVTFEDFGNFVYEFKPYKGWNEKNQKYKGCICISGNFLYYSHVFNIITDETEVIDQLRAAIRKNQQTEAYKAAKVEYLADKKLKEVAYEKFYNKEIGLQQMYSFPLSDEGIVLKMKFKNELLLSV